MTKGCVMIFSLSVAGGCGPTADVVLCPLIYIIADKIKYKNIAKRKAEKSCDPADRK